MKDVKQVKEFLDSVSPSFCLAKWSQVSLHLQTGHGHSCHHPRTHKISIEEIQKDPSNLHNTQYKEEQRRLMLQGVRPKECEYCWKLEDNGNISDRILKSAQEWSFDDKDNILNGKFKNPTYVEVSFDNTCNFKCAYCSPSVSSSWMEEMRQFGNFPTYEKFNDLETIKFQDKMPIPQKDYNPYVEAFWKWWPDLVKDLKTFRITGGEPLLSKNVWRVLDFLEDSKYPELNFAINSNLGVSDEILNKFFEKLIKIKNNVRGINLFTSVDTCGKQAEYIRFGLNYEKFMDTVGTYLDTTGLSMTYMITVTNLSLPGMLDLFNVILEQKQKYGTHVVKVDTPYLRYPAFLSVDILPQKYKKYMDGVIDLVENNHTYDGGFAKFEIERVKRVLPMIGSAPDTSMTRMHRIDFVKYINEYDRRRGTNFFATFPELLDFYYYCEGLDDV